MKRWSWWPEKAECRREWYSGIVLNVNSVVKGRQDIEQPNVRHFVAETRCLLVLAFAIAAKDERLAGIIVTAFVCRDRLSVSGRGAGVYHRV